MKAEDLSTFDDDSRRPDVSALDAGSGDGTVLAEALVKRCHELLDELEKFRQYLAERKREHTVELKPFRNSVVAELKSLEKVSCVRRTSKFQPSHPNMLDHNVC